MINREIMYERNLTGSYMKIPAGFESEFDERMMLKRKLPGLLPVEKCYVNGAGQYWYNISGRQSLDTYCRIRSIGIELIEKIIVGICSEIEILEWNLLAPDCLLLDPELIFITNSNREVIFTIYPGAKSAISAEFQQLMEYLLTKIDHTDGDAVQVAYAIYEKTMDEGYSIMDIRDSIVENRKARNPEQPTKPECQPETGQWVKTGKTSVSEGRIKEKESLVCTQKAMDRVSGLYEQLKQKGLNWLQRFSVLNFSKKQKEDVAVSGHISSDLQAVHPEDVQREEEQQWERMQNPINPTVYLGSYMDGPKGVLRYEGGEGFSDIQLTSAALRIGKGDDVDIVIPKETVSHFHAKIEHHGQEYYIEDLNSTNGTFVNDETLPYKERRKLYANDIVRFADVDYRFI